MSPKRKPQSTRASKVVWGRLEKERFLKLPKTFAFLGRYKPRVGREIQPRHLLLVVALACRKFGDEPIRATWQDVASRLGARADTVRRWAYELRDLELLEITQQQSERGRNAPNAFNHAPFVEMLEAADERWQRLQAARGGAEPAV